ncbi:hypothetical protein, partial [Streptococcus pneumoniae]|uniref:hypothetical protein n=1 Tax=Streptococcus pneumoniae TaxID=1313 RepID=UPI001E5F09AE
EFTLKWALVEESYLVDATKANYHIFPRMARLDAFLGTVNSATFCGYDPGTLLFDGYDPGDRYQQPVRTNSYAGLWAYDVML